MVNGRVHRETCAVPAQRLETERARLHRLPGAPHTAALGTTRMVNTDRRSGSAARYSTPPGLVGAEVWVRADGDELVVVVVVVADLAGLPLRPDWAGPGPLGLAEVARHRLSTPGNPRIDLANYPGHPQQPDGSPRPAPAVASRPRSAIAGARRPGRDGRCAQAAWSPASSRDGGAGTRAPPECQRMTAPGGRGGRPAEPLRRAGVAAGRPEAARVVGDIIVEWGNPLYQDTIDRFIEGQPVTDADLRPVWRNTTQSRPPSRESASKAIDAAIIIPSQDSGISAACPARK